MAFHRGGSGIPTGIPCRHVYCCGGASRNGALHRGKKTFLPLQRNTCRYFRRRAVRRVSGRAWCRPHKDCPCRPFVQFCNVFAVFGVVVAFPRRLLFYRCISYIQPEYGVRQSASLLPVGRRTCADGTAGKQVSRQRPEIDVPFHLRCFLGVVCRVFAFAVHRTQPFQRGAFRFGDFFRRVHQKRRRVLRPYNAHSQPKEVCQKRYGKKDVGV